MQLTEARCFSIRQRSESREHMRGNEGGEGSAPDWEGASLYTLSELLHESLLSFIRHPEFFLNVKQIFYEPQNLENDRGTRRTLVDLAWTQIRPGSVPKAVLEVECSVTYSVALASFLTRCNCGLEQHGSQGQRFKWQQGMGRLSNVKGKANVNRREEKRRRKREKDESEPIWNFCEIGGLDEATGEDDFDNEDNAKRRGVKRSIGRPIMGCWFWEENIGCRRPVHPKIRVEGGIANCSFPHPLSLHV
ncbi:hypothetical protein BKA70DRAFT_1234968 [Coprinopsis sp. MPI-PUGE-AT-0042]|nr:hypothetical protein BKA70DRAFT_1234968 [Coprinopsis sp. MPI-PUGE-AT-0042]